MEHEVTTERMRRQQELLDDEVLRLGYALTKQLWAEALESGYGRFELDYEMRVAVEKVLRPRVERMYKAAKRKAEAMREATATLAPQRKLPRTQDVEI